MSSHLSTIWNYELKNKWKLELKKTTSHKQCYKTFDKIQLQMTKWILLHKIEMETQPFWKKSAFRNSLSIFFNNIASIVTKYCIVNLPSNSASQKHAATTVLQCTMLFSYSVHTGRRKLYFNFLLIHILTKTIWTYLLPGAMKEPMWDNTLERERERRTRILMLVRRRKREKTG